MSDLLVIEFPSEEKAEGVRTLLLAMQKEYLIELGDAVVAVKDANGRVKYRSGIPGSSQALQKALHCDAT